MMWTPQAVVAVLLVLVIGAVLLVNSLLPVIAPDFVSSADRLSAWSNVIHFVLGGVVAWIAGPVLKNGKHDGG